MSNKNKVADKSAAPQLPAANEENISDLPSEIPSTFTEPEIKPESAAPQLPAEVDVFQETLMEAGIKNPQLFENPLGKMVKTSEEKNIQAKIKARMLKGETVYVISTVSNGDYPSRVRRSEGEKFQLKAAEDFSIYWMKLAE